MAYERHQQMYVQLLPNRKHYNRFIQMLNSLFWHRSQFKAFLAVGREKTQ